jgi:hypothetical protein
VSSGQDRIKTALRAFAENEAAGVSPLYEHLASRIAEDDEVAGLLAAAEEDFARPTLLFAAAHRLVIAEPISELANYYPSVGGSYGVDGVTWPMFREFILARAEKMRELIAAHTTQTNEVRRAAAIYPAVALAAKQARMPVGLLEVGASAGLLLGMDRYGYRYALPGGEQASGGPTKATLVLQSTLELADGAAAPALPKKLPVAGKVGLDRAPVDLADEEELAWLEACIWADQPDRLRRLGLAAAAQRADPPELITGDAVGALPDAAGRFPAGAPLVVLTSHTLCYLNADRRAEFVAALHRLAEDRPLWWISQENYRCGLNLLLPDREDLTPSAGDGGRFAVLGMVRWTSGKADARALARTAGHGERIEWLAG